MGCQIWLFGVDYVGRMNLYNLNFQMVTYVRVLASVLRYARPPPTLRDGEQLTVRSGIEA
jgi:hypothetical protein